MCKIASIPIHANFPLDRVPVEVEMKGDFVRSLEGREGPLTCDVRAGRGHLNSRKVMEDGSVLWTSYVIERHVGNTG